MGEHVGVRDEALSHEAETLISRECPINPVGDFRLGQLLSFGH